MLVRRKDIRRRELFLLFMYLNSKYIQFWTDRRGYKHVGDALLRIFREEGFNSLFRGIEPNICRAMAMNVGMMATYDQVRIEKKTSLCVLLLLRMDNTVLPMQIQSKETIQAATKSTGFLTELAASGLAGAACAVS